MPDARAPEDHSPPAPPERPPDLASLIAGEAFFAQHGVKLGYSPLGELYLWVMEQRAWLEYEGDDSPPSANSKADPSTSQSLDERRAAAAGEPRLPDGDPDGPLDKLIAERLRGYRREREIRHADDQGEGSVVD